MMGSFFMGIGFGFVIIWMFFAMIFSYYLLVEKGDRRGGWIILAGALGFAGNLCISVEGGDIESEGNVGIVVFGFLLAGVAVSLVAYVIYEILEDKKAKAIQDEKDRKKAFFEECIKNGIRKCKGEKAIQKMTLIAQKYHLEFSNISDLFDEAAALAEQETQSKEAEQLQSMRDNESSECKQLEEYSDLFGREKRIAILSEERKAALESSHAMLSSAAFFMNMSQEKEQDTAIRAGIASGIGGAGAGIAAALNSEAKNAEIRSQNAARREALKPTMDLMDRAASRSYTRADALEKEIEDAKTKLVADDDPKVCLARLVFSQTNVSVSKTGTCTVTAVADLKAPFKIFGDVRAIIDGTVIAVIHKGGKVVGEASLVLPKYGVQSKTPLKGMCLFCGTPGEKYEVTFRANNLWAMER